VSTKHNVPKIECGIPIPQKRGKGLQPNSVTGILRQLQPMESVLLPQKITSVARLVGFVKRDTGAQFTCRTVEGGTRIWRLS